ncbi:unnamed protein product [Prunus brigantina]
MKNQLKLSTSLATFPATASCTVTWNRCSNRSYTAGGTHSGSGSLGLSVSVLCFQAYAWFY